jgi:hypothetical protein
LEEDEVATYFAEAFRERCERKMQQWMDEQFSGAKLLVDVIYCSKGSTTIKLSVRSADGKVLMDMPERDLSPGCTLTVEGLKIGMDTRVQIGE